jgi:hypothetical protein
VSEYNDDYPTCESTYATLRIYPGDVSLDEIGGRLGFAPTSVQAGEIRPPGMKDFPAGWFLTSKGAVDSRDIRRHLDWILDRIADKTTVFDELRDAGIQGDISCFWASASGHGGPSLWPRQMALLGMLGLQIEFDVYLGSP